MFIVRKTAAVWAAQRCAKALLPWAALSVSAAGCALEAREGDGLVSDGREIRITPSVVVDAGRPGSDAGALETGKTCQHLDLYEQYLVPLLAQKYPASPEPIACIDCHDGTKPKAAAALLMSGDKAFAADDCQIALILGATKADLLQAELLTSSDPARPDVVHDFKFKTGEEYTRFRDGVLVWLKAEKK